MVLTSFDNVVEVQKVFNLYQKKETVVSGTVVSGPVVCGLVGSAPDDLTIESKSQETKLWRRWLTFRQMLKSRTGNVPICFIRREGLARPDVRRRTCRSPRSNPGRKIRQTGRWKYRKRYFLNFTWTGMRTWDILDFYFLSPSRAIDWPHGWYFLSVSIIFCNDPSLLWPCRKS